MAFSPLTGYVTANGVQLPASEWDADLDQASVDRSSFVTAGEPLTAPGQRTGEITIGGPYEFTSGIAFDRGDLVTLVEAIDSATFLTVQIRVRKFKTSNDKDAGPKWQIVGAQHGAVTRQGI